MYWIIGLMLLAIVVLGIYLSRRGASMDGSDHNGQQMSAAYIIRGRHTDSDSSLF